MALKKAFMQRITKDMMDDAEQEIQNDQLTRMLTKYGAYNYDGTPTKLSLSFGSDDSPAKKNMQDTSKGKSNKKGDTVVTVPATIDDNDDTIEVINRSNSKFMIMQFTLTSNSTGNFNYIYADITKPYYENYSLTITNGYIGGFD